MNWYRNSRFYADGTPAVGLLILRLVMGLALVLHGTGKISTPFSWMGPDAPVPGILQALAAASEFFGGLGLMVGAFTPIAALGVMSTMFVAILAHLSNPASPTYFVKPGDAKVGDSYESAAGYFVFALALFLIGPGLLSFDALVSRYIFKRRPAPVITE